MQSQPPKSVSVVPPDAPPRLPTFVIVGVQKAATSSIYTYLSQHPQIYTSSLKEPNFLERDWQQYYEAGGAHKASRIDTFEKYAHLFSGVTDEIAIGEASANCLFHHATSVPQIQRYVPDAQIVIALRHPAERAHSDYLMHLRDAINGGPRRSLSEQIREHSEKSFIIRKGFYAEGVSHFMDAFGRDRVKVILYDDFCRNPQESMADLYQFLGVDPTFTPDMSRRSQTARVPKNRQINALLQRKNPLRSAVTAGLKLLMPETARARLRQRLIQMNSQDKSTLPLTPEDRQALIALYRDDVLQLQTLLQRDLSNWLK